MDQNKAEELIRKLTKRGFKRDSAKDFCEACKVSALHVWKLLGRTGGRDIKWCMACEKISSFRRSANDDVVEDVDFDLEKFLT